MASSIDRARAELPRVLSSSAAGHEAAEQSEGAYRSQHSPILGLFADEPGSMDEVCESAMESRERDPLGRRG